MPEVTDGETKRFRRRGRYPKDFYGDADALIIDQDFPAEGMFA